MIKSKMNGQVLYGIKDLRYEQIDIPEIKEDEVLVKVMAAGICGSDVPRTFQTGAHRHPIVLGHEFSGMVVAVGEKVSSDWLHKAVGIFPLLPCKECNPCRKKEYEMCRNYNYLGSRCHGGFAEYVAVPVWNLIELPKEVSYEAAAMLEPMAVAVHAMRKVRPKKNETVVVCGQGTIGLLLVMFLMDLGVSKILIVGNKESQKRYAGNLGIESHAFCNSQKMDAASWIMEQTGGLGPDVFFDCVGKNETLQLAVDTTAAAGRVMLVGNPYSDISLKKDVYWKILRNQLTLYGTWNSSFTGEKEDDWNYVLDCLQRGAISPEKLITHRMNLEQLQEGLTIMKEKKEDYIKIMIVNQ